MPHGSPAQTITFQPLVQLEKGQEMGGFKLGSTVVLVFEAPSSFTFTLNQDQKIQLGQSLGQII